MTGGGALVLPGTRDTFAARDTEERRVSLLHQGLVLVISKAREQAKELLTPLEGQGHPQTNESSAVYLAPSR